MSDWADVCPDDANTICEVVEEDRSTCMRILFCWCQIDGINFNYWEDFEDMEGCSPT